MLSWLKKKAFVPLTMAAEQAPPAAAQPAQQPGMMPAMMPPAADPQMQAAPMDQSAMMGQADPAAGMQGMAPQMVDPNMQQGGASMQIDPQTGFIILDPQQGIMQDPLTGILYNAQTDEYAAPDGSGVIPKEQAIQMIEQARMSMQQMPQDGGQPVTGAPMQAPMQAAPTQPAMMQQPVSPQPQAMPQPAPMQQTAADNGQVAADAMGGIMPQGTYNESTGMYMDPTYGMPIDQATGLLIDPATGQQIDPSTGQQVAGASGADPNAAATDESVPMDEYFNTIITSTQATEKNVDRIQKETSGLRTDLQGLRREIQKTNDTQDTVMARMDNLLNVMESIIGQPAMTSQLPTDNTAV